MTQKNGNKGAYPHYGFTLMEILIVIAVIGILASVTIAGLDSARTGGRDSARVSDLERVKLGLSLYFASCRRYPNALATGDTSGGACSQALDTFLPGLPVLDPQGTDYNTHYATSTDGLDYVVGIPLEQANRVLEDDIDTADVFGLGTLDCTDPMYCVGP